MNEFVEGITKVGVYLFDIYLSKLPALQAFSLVITGILLFFVVLMMRRMKTLEMKRDKSMDKWGLIDMSKEKQRRMWKDLLGEAAKGSDVKLKKALSDADGMLDEAHRLVMRTKKEPTLPLTAREGWNIIGIYEKALKELGTIK